VGAAPTGVSSEAEYAELGLSSPMDPEALRDALDAVLPDGLDVVDAVTAAGPGLPDRIEVSRWRLELPGVDPALLSDAVAKFTAAEQVLVERLTKQGRRTLDARAAVVDVRVAGSGTAESPNISEPSRRVAQIGAPSEVSSGPCAILDLVVRHVTPSVRPDEVLAGLRVVADLEPPVPVRATRLAQGTLTEHGEIADPLEVDRQGTPQR